ncbi:MAG TPA: LytTR family DNA-binding domain-containing protein [Tenuifilaceae bacterium]|nr:LytTR family DNA-binding domain-containing protein [Tenuifilaceae bacterium]
MINAVIVDDESKARQTIEEMLKTYCPQVSIIGQADSVENAFEIINHTKPDVVFLDIRMPDGTGFDLLKRFESVWFHFVIITAFEDYAVAAFKYSAIDYILKPIDPSDLYAAVEKLSRTINLEENKKKIDTLLSNVDNPNSKPNKIVLKTSDNIHVVDIQNIVRCESQNNYTQFFFESGKSILISKTLKEFDDMLASSGFIRVHQSHLVNKRFVKQLKRFPQLKLIMFDDSEIPVAVRKKDYIIEQMEGR